MDANRANDAQARRIDAEARRWVAHLHSGSATNASRAEFEAWLAADVRHASAYRAHAQLMLDLGICADTFAEGVSQPRAQARRRAQANWTPVAAAAGLVLAAALGLLAVLRSEGASDLPAFADPSLTRTTTGEIRELTLADGTVVTLGARSHIRSQFSDELREVVLLEGEAFFDVTSDPSRPFLVHAGEQVVRVVGTQFDVRRATDSVRISVVEGVVEVASSASADTRADGGMAAPQMLRSGEQIVARAGDAEIARSEVRPEMAAAWRRGWLIYEDASLAEIVADANRYSLRQIEIADPELQEIRITAAFGADQSDIFVEGLAASYPIAVDRLDPERIVLKASAQ